MKINQHIITIVAALLALGGFAGSVAATVPADSNDKPSYTALQSLGSNTSVVLAIDTSDSMYGLPLESAKEAAQLFVENLGSNTPVAVVTFSSRAELVHDFSANHAQLQDVIGSLHTSGVTALYDGSLLAVETASQANTPQRVVVLLSDGSEFGGQSAALREDAQALAADEDILVYAIGLGFGADRTFLQELVADDVGELFEAPTPSELAAIYTDLAQRVAAESEAMEATTPAELTEDGGEIIPAIAAETQLADASETVFGTNVLTSNLPFDLPAPPQRQADPLIITDSITENAPAFIPAAGDDLSTLLTDSTDVGPVLVDSNASELASIRIPVPTVGEEDEIEAVLGDAAVADVLDSGIVPVSITVNAAQMVDSAELIVNGYSLAAFDSAPYVYDMDLSRLEPGVYDMIFSVTYDSGSAAVGNSEFTVVETVTEGGTTLLSTEFDGIESSALNFEFSPEAGLSILQTQENILTDSPGGALDTMSLTTILTRPVDNLLPAEWMEVITKPRPVAASIIVIMMTLTLLPQGIFTMVWMLYTWNNPEAAEDYASPTTYETPKHKFTALVPARKEAEVIYTTIRSVAAIDYPKELMEVLVLIRDDGEDDDTLAESNRAIRDLGPEYNVRLVTFNDGPFNKPNGLNRGFDQGTGDVYCIFDAEDHPNPEIYNIVNTTMIRKGADVVQSGVQLMTDFNANGTEAWFAPLNVLEYFFWFKSGLHCFTREFSVTPLGGNTVFGKRDWLEKIAMPHHRRDEGHDIMEIWDEQCLTEDADLGIRLTNKGASIQIVYSAEHATQEETPSSNEQFIKQRTRWMQGFYEIFRKGEWASMPMMKQKIVGIYILLNSLLQASLVIFLPVGIYIALTQEIPVPLAILSWIPIYLLLMQMMTQLVGIREYAEAYDVKMPRGYRLKMMMYYYPYQLLLAVSAARAVGRFVAGTNNWEKTAHSGAHRGAAHAVPATPAAPVASPAATTAQV